MSSSNKSRNNSSLYSFKSEIKCLILLVIIFILMTYLEVNLNQIPNKLCTYGIYPTTTTTKSNNIESFTNNSNPTTTKSNDKKNNSNITNVSSGNVQFNIEQNGNSAEVILTGCIQNPNEIEPNPDKYELRKGVSIASPIFSTINIILIILISYCLYCKANNDDFYTNLKDFLGQNVFTKYLSIFIEYILNFRFSPIYLITISIVIALMIVPFIFIGIVQNQLNNKWDDDLVSVSTIITLFIIFTIYILIKFKKTKTYFILITICILFIILCSMTMRKIIDLKTGNISCFSKENVSKDDDILYIENDCIFKDDKDPYNNGRIVMSIMSRITILFSSMFILEFLVAQKLSNSKSKIGIRIINLIMTIIYVVFIILYR